MYEYKPLDRHRKEIRLLTLQPGSGDDMLCCTLEHEFLDTPTPPHYETISYVCGNQAKKATINLHGSETEVPATSEAALRRMRRQDRPRILWIEAVCINENDIAERGHQVGMMYEIYTHTRHNCIYLGWSDDGSMPKVMESMEAIMREISVETRDYADFQEMLFDDIGHPNRSSNPFSFDIAQSACSSSSRIHGSHAYGLSRRPRSAVPAPSIAVTFIYPCPAFFDARRGLSTSGFSYQY